MNGKTIKVLMRVLRGRPFKRRLVAVFRKALVSKELIVAYTASFISIAKVSNRNCSLVRWSMSTTHSLLVLS